MADFISFVKRIGCRISAANDRRDVEDEILDHLEATTLELQAEGLSREDAKELATQQFGDPDEIGKKLGRVHNAIKFRYFAVGGLLWYVMGAIIFESKVIFMASNWSSPLPYWLVQLPFQVLGLPHWFAQQSPQIRGLTILDPLARFMGESFRIAWLHVDGTIATVILTLAAYGVYRLARAFRTTEAHQAWSLLKMAFKS